MAMRPANETTVFPGGINAAATYVATAVCAFARSCRLLAASIVL